MLSGGSRESSPQALTGAFHHVLCWQALHFTHLDFPPSQVGLVHPRFLKLTACEVLHAIPDALRQNDALINRESEGLIRDFRQRTHFATPSGPADAIKKSTERVDQPHRLIKVSIGDRGQGVKRGWRRSGFGPFDAVLSHHDQGHSETHAAT